MKEIPLTKGKVALVDDEDYGWLSAFRWCALQVRCHRFYVVRNVPRGEGRRGTIYMHRAIACPPAGLQVDHINGDSLDNRRLNLRVATNAQNNRNRGVSKNNTSGFKGVCWDGQTKKWVAHIETDGRQKKLGRFDTPKAAHAAYCSAAKELHQDFARFA